MTPSYDDDLPGPAGITRAAERAWDQTFGPGPDEVDAAIATLRKAKDILQNGRLMAACRERQQENARALKARAGKENGNG